MKRLFLCLVPLLALGCGSPGKMTNGRLPSDALQRLWYQASIEDAAYPAPGEAYQGLLAIRRDNQQLRWKEIGGAEYVLVATWKQDTSYYQPDSAGFYNTGDYPIWVTAVPEMQEWCATQAPPGGPALQLRLQQLLGLPTTADYQYFVEFWVKPESIFRPCPDNEASDTACGTCFPAEADPAYLEWFNNNRLGSYYNCSLYDNYPWTQLGYTYDWNPANKNHIGLSEFVIRKGQQIVPHRIFTTEEYCQREKRKAKKKP